MSKGKNHPLHVIAMHGWASDSRCWEPWKEATSPLGWQWNCGERGYGAGKTRAPSWAPDGGTRANRLVIAHSLGVHLLPTNVLSQADAVVLLASFGAFVPPDRAGRRVRAALAAMAAKLCDEESARGMLHQFLANAADPQPVELMPQGPLDDESLDLAKLRQDLDLLQSCQGLPAEFPRGAGVLLIDATGDKIVAPEARALLRSSLPGAKLVQFESAGHALLGTDVIGPVVDWVKSWR